jgi:MSHA pilin protein MshA
MKRSKMSGFTLIELVVVITILGILAAFAVPKFVALDSQARIATVNGLEGSVKSAAALARGMAMATGSTVSVTMEGAAAAVTLLNNYPDVSATGISTAVNTSANDFTYAVAAGVGTWTRVGARTPATCTVSYTPAAVGGVPAVGTQTAGC